MCTCWRLQPDLNMSDANELTVPEEVLRRNCSGMRRLKGAGTTRLLRYPTADLGRPYDSSNEASDFKNCATLRRVDVAQRHGRQLGPGQREARSSRTESNRAQPGCKRKSEDLACLKEQCEVLPARAVAERRNLEDESRSPRARSRTPGALYTDRKRARAGPVQPFLKHPVLPLKRSVGGTAAHKVGGGQGHLPPFVANRGKKEWAGRQKMYEDLRHDLARQRQDWVRVAPERRHSRHAMHGGNVPESSFELEDLRDGPGLVEGYLLSYSWLSDRLSPVQVGENSEGTIVLSFPYNLNEKGYYTQQVLCCDDGEKLARRGGDGPLISKVSRCRIDAALRSNHEAGILLYVCIPTVALNAMKCSYSQSRSQDLSKTKSEMEGNDRRKASF
ncbi:hypothetical protein C8R47DRAFT_1196820 [Mycena vitilis]|nr:hypothetical protein C8R47DRAFT_1196820 [Mycena vitilis]